MGFSDLDLAFEEQAAFEQLAEAVRVSDYRPKLDGSPKPRQVLENLDLDPQIPDEPTVDWPASRRELIQALGDGTKIGPATARSNGTRFCREHKQEGRSRGKIEALGDVRSLSKLAAWLRDRSSQTSPGQTLAWLRDLVSLPGDSEIRLERQRAGLGKQMAGISKNSLTPFQMWSFHADDPLEPFSVLNPRRSELRSRLGLGYLDDPKDELVYWTHILPSGVTAHRPTAWDAELENPWWRPTGRTEPLDGSGSDRGFPEVVHDPIGLEALTAPITEAEP